MKKFIKIFLVTLSITVIGMSLGACNNSDTDGEDLVNTENAEFESEIDETVEPDEPELDIPIEYDDEDLEDEEEVDDVESDNSFESLQAYVDERGEGIADGFEAMSMTHTATVSVAGDNAVLISITLEDEFVQTMSLTLDFMTAVLEDIVASVMLIFSEEAGRVEAELGIDGFHFIFEFALSTGNVFAWQSIFADEVMGDFTTDFSFLFDEVDEPEPETTTSTDGERTTIEFDRVTVSLETPIVMTSDEFLAEFTDWTLGLSTHFRWMLVYAEITNNTDKDLTFGNRPFMITDDFDDTDFQSTAYDRLNGTGFDITATIAPGDTLSGYVPFIVSRHASSFEICVRPRYVDDGWTSSFFERFVFNFDVGMD